jgi:hypothetical protein
MEDVLYQYALPYDPLHPQICFDERPCFLIEDVGSILPMSPGKAKRGHYEYAKNGSCCVMLAFEPHTGCNRAIPRIWATQKLAFCNGKSIAYEILAEIALDWNDRFSSYLPANR